MSDIDPEGFTRCEHCGPMYTYAGHIEPGQMHPDCPIHGIEPMFNAMFGVE